MEREELIRVWVKKEDRVKSIWLWFYIRVVANRETTIGDPEKRVTGNAAFNRSQVGVELGVLVEQ